MSAKWGTCLRDLDLRTCVNLMDEALLDICRRFGGLTRLNLSDCWTALSNRCETSSPTFSHPEADVSQRGALAPPRALLSFLPPGSLE